MSTTDEPQAPAAARSPDDDFDSPVVGPAPGRPRAATAPAPQAGEVRRPLPPLPGGRRAGRRVVRRRVVVRKLDPWSVLKLSVIFYFAVLLIVMLGLTVFWAVVNELGIIETALSFLAELQFVVEYDIGNIARALFLVGLLNVVLFSAINVFLCFVYNLVADLVGGFRMTLAEEEP